jgi:hypothetical protein
MVFDLTDEATIQKKAAISLRVTRTAETPNFRVELIRQHVARLGPICRPEIWNLADEPTL